MIVKFKLYESINQGEPEVGDYVICHERGIDDELTDFEDSHIGQIVRDDYDLEEFSYLVKYDYPENLTSFFNSSCAGDDKGARAFGRWEIKYWSKNREDLEHIISAKQYNL